MKKKGFTLIELLAIIFIIGIVLVITVPSVSNIIVNSYKRSYELNLSSLKKAAKDYVVKKSVRIKDGEQKIVTINRLVQENFIKEVRDPQSKELCEGYLVITKNGKNYTYEPFLKCGESFLSENYDDTNLIPPTIILLGDNPVNIYIGDTYHDAGAIARDYQNFDITGEIVVNSNLNTMIPGEYFITYTVLDEAGNIGKATRTINVIDNVKPEITFDPNENNTYSRRSDVAIKVVDIGGVDKESLKYIWTTSSSQPSLSEFVLDYKVNELISTPANFTGTYYLWATAKDMAGNQTIKGSKGFKLDNTEPVIQLLGENPTTIDVDSDYIDAGATARDNIDGDVTNRITITGTVNPNVIGTYTITYMVSDEAGNVATATRTVNVVDLTSPTITFSPNGNSTYAKSRTTKVTVSDAHSGVNTSSLKYLWSTSSSGVTAGQITTSFTNGVSLNTPSSVTGNYYLWILAKDKSDNQKIERSNAFKLDNTRPVISLNGNSNVTIARGTAYTDAGATATDNIDGSVTVTASGSVNPNVIGTYTITYNAIDSSGNEANPVTRKINVIDVQAPVITVLGDNPVTINVGSAYNDAGATALDDVDGDLTSSIVTTGTVNPNVIGTYTITYRATDSSNNVATATRTVNVVDLTSPTITFSPNGNSTYAKSRTTKVTVSDNVIVNTSSLKYLWSTSSTGVTAGQITNSFTNGGTINTP
ncbi:MAG TPA: DUF5011 domain-containing protein, partial [Mollicutes bacterium]|nr:DUF5011 domain-containing protein [Mollicutes bacterium]